MITPSFFYTTLQENGTDFFTGVPDSLLKNICAYITDNASENSHIIAANEGSATALATGYHLASGKIPLVYMQNSGIGNAVNPLLSLVDPDVYSIPMLFLVGWRGEPGVKDEPQHVKQGKVTTNLFSAMDIPYTILEDNETEVRNQLQIAYQYIKNNNAPYTLIIRKDTFAEYTLQKKEETNSTFSREEAIENIILHAKEDSIFVSTTGMISRELFELRERHNMGHAADFLTVGSMGHASQIAFSIAIHKPDRTVYCIDGDGASLMQMGGMATIGTSNVKNLVHIVLNNGAHDSVGGQPTVANKIDLSTIAKACGYSYTKTVESKDTLQLILSEINNKSSPELSFFEVKVKKGARKDLGRPTTTTHENKDEFMQFLKK